MVAKFGENQHFIKMCCSRSQSFSTHKQHTIFDTILPHSALSKGVHGANTKIHTNRLNSSTCSASICVSTEVGKSSEKASMSNSTSSVPGFSNVISVLRSTTLYKRCKNANDLPSPRDFKMCSMYLRYGDVESVYPFDFELSKKLMSFMYRVNVEFESYSCCISFCGVSLDDL